MDEQIDQPEQIAQPKAWSEVISQDGWNTMPHDQRVATYNEWNGYARQYAEQQGLLSTPKQLEAFNNKSIQTRIGVMHPIQGAITNFISPALELEQRLSRGLQLGAEYTAAGFKQVIADAFAGTRNPYVDKTVDEAKQDVPYLENLLGTLQAEMETHRGKPGTQVAVGNLSNQIMDTYRQLNLAKEATLGKSTEGIGGALSRSFESEADANRANMGAISSKFSDTINPNHDKNFWMQVADSLGQSAPTTGAAMLNKWFGLALMYSQTYEQSRQSFLDAGGEKDKAAGYATQQAALQTPFELVGDVLAAKAAKNALASIVQGGGGVKSWATFIKKSATELAQAVGGEALITTPAQTLIQQIGEEHAGISEHLGAWELTKMVAQQSAVAAAQSLIMAGGPQAVAAGYHAANGTFAVASPNVPPAEKTKVEGSVETIKNLQAVGAPGTAEALATITAENISPATAGEIVNEIAPAGTFTGETVANEKFAPGVAVEPTATGEVTGEAAIQDSVNKQAVSPDGENVAPTETAQPAASANVPLADQIAAKHNDVNTTGTTFNVINGNLEGQDYAAVSTRPDLTTPIPGKNITPAQVQNFITKAAKAGIPINSTEYSIGTWYNAKNDTTYLDVTQTVQDRAQAIELGKQANQIAIFDLKTGQEISTGGTGEAINGTAQTTPTTETAGQPTAEAANAAPAVGPTVAEPTAEGQPVAEPSATAVVPEQAAAPVAEVAKPTLEVLEQAAAKAKADLEAIGPEPHKRSNEGKTFGSQGRAGADPVVVAKYDADVKTYEKWKRQYSKLKKAEVATSNEAYYERERQAKIAQQAAPVEQVALEPAKPVRGLKAATPDNLTALNAHDLLDVKAPHGATVLRITDSEGHVMIEDIKNFNEKNARKAQNVFKDAGPFTKVEAGIEDSKGNFKPVAGDLTIENRQQAKMKNIIRALPQDEQTKAFKAMVEDTSPEPYETNLINEPMTPEQNKGLFDQLAKLGVFDDNSDNAVPTFQRIADNKANPTWMREIAGVFAKHAGNLEIEAVYRPDSGWAALYTGEGETGKILVNTAAHIVDLQAALLHEGSHHITLGKVDGLIAVNEVEAAAIDDLHLIWQTSFEAHPEAFGNTQNGVFYGFQDVREFIAEAMSNAGFREKLNEITVTGEKFTVWQKVVNALARVFFGRSVAPGSMLEAAMDRILTFDGEPVLETSGKSQLGGFLNKISNEAYLAGFRQDAAWLKRINDANPGMHHELNQAYGRGVRAKRSTSAIMRVSDTVAAVNEATRLGQLNDKNGFAVLTMKRPGWHHELNQAFGRGMRTAREQGIGGLHAALTQDPNAPEKTITGYKLFRQKAGELFPLFIGKNEPTPVGVWIKAKDLRTKGFAARPGWHAGELPTAPHLRTKQNQIAEGRVWAEVSVSADKSYQEEADKTSTRDIRDHPPENGYYKFKTSKMQGGGWIIGGAIKVERILSDKEIHSILTGAGDPEGAIAETRSHPLKVEKQIASAIMPENRQENGRDYILSQNQLNMLFSSWKFQKAPGTEDHYVSPMGDSADLTDLGNGQYRAQLHNPENNLQDKFEQAGRSAGVSFKGDMKAVLFHPGVSAMMQARAVGQLLQQTEAPEGLKLEEQKQLTSEQSKLVVDNLNIAGKIARKFDNIPLTSYDELNAEARYGLVKAAATYDAAKGASFSTYAGNVISNTMRDLYKKKIRQSNKETSSNVSIDSEDSAGTTMQDSFTYPDEQPQADQGALDVINEARSKLSERDQKILNDFASGQTLDAVGKLNGGITREGIRKIIKRAGAQIMTALNEAGIDNIDNIFPPQEQRTQATAKESVAPYDEQALSEGTVGNLEAKDLSKQEQAVEEPQAIGSDWKVMSALSPEGQETSVPWFSVKNGLYRPLGKVFSAAGRWSSELYSSLKVKNQAVKGAYANIRYFNIALEGAYAKNWTSKGLAVPRDIVLTALGSMANTYTKAQTEAANKIRVERVKSPETLQAEKNFAADQSKENSDALRAAQAQDDVDHDLAVTQTRNAFLLTAKLENLEIFRGKQAAALASLPTDVQDIVISMREQLDTLSRELQKTGNISDQLAYSIDDTMGVHVMRSYTIFNDPKGGWVKWVRESADTQAETIRNNALNFFRQQALAEAAVVYAASQRKAGTPVSKTQALAFVQNLPNVNTRVSELFTQYTQVADENTVDMMRGQKTGAKNQSILKIRDQVPVEIRALWGEVTDPALVFAHSTASITSFLANHTFQQDVLADGKAKGYLWTADITDSQGNRVPMPDGYVKIVGEESTSMDVLAGTYGPPMLRDAFKDLKAKDMRNWLSTATLFAMNMKTTFSAQALIRNFLGNVGFVIANGNLFSGNYIHAFQSAFAQFNGKTSQTMRDYLVRLTKLGIIGDNVGPGILNELGSSAHDSTLRPLNTIDNLLKRQATKVKRLVVDKAQDAYSGVDDYWKIFSFEAELAKVKRAHPTMSAEQQDRLASDKVRATLPTYSEAFKVSRDLFRGPAGTIFAPFITFTTEIIRVTKGTAETSWSEMHSKNPEEQKNGYKRMIGGLAALALPTILSLATRAAFHYDDKDEEAIRRGLPDYQKNNTLVFIKRDEKGHPRFWDLSYMNPYNYITDPIKAASRAVTNAKSASEAGLNAVIDSLKQLGKPFVNEQLLAGAFMSVWRNTKPNGGKVYNEKDTSDIKALKIINEFWKVYIPGLGTSAWNIYKGATHRIDKTGREFTLGQELLAPIMKVVTYDPEQTLKYKVAAFKGGRQASSQLFGSVYGSKESLAPGDITRAYNAANQANKETAAELQQDYQAALQLGVPKAAAIKILKAEGAGAMSVREAQTGLHHKFKPGAALINERKFSDPVKQEYLKARLKAPGIEPLE